MNYKILNNVIIKWKQNFDEIKMKYNTILEIQWNTVYLTQFLIFCNLLSKIKLEYRKLYIILSGLLWGVANVPTIQWKTLDILY